jgi:hypothetical protein
MLLCSPDWLFDGEEFFSGEARDRTAAASTLPYFASRPKIRNRGANANGGASRNR